MCTCGPKPKTRIHYLLRYNLYSDLRIEPLNNICASDSKMRLRDFDFPRRIHAKCPPPPNGVLGRIRYKLDD